MLRSSRDAAGGGKRRRVVGASGALEAGRQLLAPPPQHRIAYRFIKATMSASGICNPLACM